ncbi:MAG TPA: AMP-binding protein, partial [Methylomirabilota bacterium]|nr:AMP-binding protein [Methylomirabilota bacterium]
KDASPRLLLCADVQAGRAVVAGLADGLSVTGFDEVFAAETGSPGAGRVDETPGPLQDSSLVTIIYTSGTSGDSKGVCLNVANVTHMIGCTTERLNQLIGAASRPDQVFHYLPFNFAGSWILLLSCLARESVLALSTDLARLAEEIPRAAPDYFLNVPTLLERVRRGVEEKIAKQNAVIRWLYARAASAWAHGRAASGRALDGWWLLLGRVLIFRTIRARFGPNLRAIICGSAPLAPETQEFFLMLGIPVLQVYGLTETTAICTMDDPRRPPEPGCVGPAVSGTEMRVGENEEILVRGPHIFPGYWKRPEETARVFLDGWFRTGDQGEVNAGGNWRITGRIKNLIVLNSGHNVAPEPIEEKVLQLLPGAQQSVLVGNGRGYLCMLVTGAVGESAVQTVLDSLNPGLPHYRQVRGFLVIPEPFTSESGLLTVNGKLRRDAIYARFAREIEALYEKTRMESEPK